MNMILMIDNQDSFTYNLIDYIKVQTTEEVKIISVNDLMTQHLDALNPRAIVISPGPGKPSDYPIIRIRNISPSRSHFGRLFRFSINH